MKIKVKKLTPEAVVPTLGSKFAAGADLYSAEKGDVVIAPGETKFIGTGIAVEIPEGYVGLVYARSGLACKRGLAPANKVGVIDSDYRGEIKGSKIPVRSHPCFVMLFPPAGIAIFIYFEFRPKLFVFLFQLRNSLQCTFQ